MTKQLFMFFLLGGILTLLEWMGFYALTYLLHFHYILSSIIMFLFTSLIGVYVYKFFIFKHTSLKPYQEILRTYLINTFGLIIHLIILDFCIRFFMIEAILSKIIASFCSAVYGFFARKLWIYSNKENQ